MIAVNRFEDQEGCRLDMAYSSLGKHIRAEAKGKKGYCNVTKIPNSEHGVFSINYDADFSLLGTGEQCAIDLNQVGGT